MTYHQQKVWLWSRDCNKILLFVVMQRVERVCHRQLSYLSDGGGSLSAQILEILEMKGNAKCENCRFEPRFRDLGVTHRVHL